MGLNKNRGYVGHRPWSMSFDPGGQFVYMVINIYHPFDGVYGAAVDPTPGSLTFVSGPAATDPDPTGAVAEPSQGRFLFVNGGSSAGSPVIVPHAIDPSTGVISNIPGQAARLPLAHSVRMVIVAPLH
jgi:hypothetical protein